MNHFEEALKFTCGVPSQLLRLLEVFEYGLLLVVRYCREDITVLFDIKGAGEGWIQDY